MATTEATYTIYCPRCDRGYVGVGASKEEAAAMSYITVRDHVDEQHPDMVNPFREPGL